MDFENRNKNLCEHFSKNLRRLYVHYHHFINRLTLHYKSYELIVLVHSDFKASYNLNIYFTKLSSRVYFRSLCSNMAPCQTTEVFVQEGSCGNQSGKRF